MQSIRTKKDSKSEISFFEKHYLLVVILLLLVFALQVLYEIYTYFPTYDEDNTIQAGFRYLKTGIYEIGYDHHLPLRTLNALPFLAYNYTMPKPNLYHWGEKTFDIWKQSRIITLIYGILLGILVFFWARELFGLKVGLLALFLYSFEPNIITHSSLITTDMLISLTFFSASYFFYKFLKFQTLKWALVAGFFLGLALISKWTAILLFPIFAIFVVMNFKRNKLWRIVGLIAVMLIMCVFIINAAYLFRGTFHKLGIRQYNAEPLKYMSEVMPNLIVPLPSEYLREYDMAKGFAEDKNQFASYLFGRYYKDSLWYYFFISFLLKTPIPLLLLILLSFFIIIKKHLKSASYLFIPVLIIFISFSFFNKLNLGLRYVLPVYPFMIVMAGVSIFAFTNHRSKSVLCILLVWYILSAAFIAPYYLSYANELIGGPKNLYKYFIGSNIDWGQGERARIQYQGQSSVPVIITPGCEYTAGRVVLSVNAWADLFSDRQCHAWLRNLNLTPVATPGYSYLVFDVPPRNTSNETIQ